MSLKVCNWKVRCCEGKSRRKIVLVGQPRDAVVHCNGRRFYRNSC